MNNEHIQVNQPTVAATAFGEEAGVDRVEFDLLDPRLTQEAPRTEVTLPCTLKCIRSKTGKTCFRASDTALGTVFVVPVNGVPEELVGKSGRLTLAVLAGTKLSPSGELGFIMPTKPVKFVNFD